MIRLVAPLALALVSTVAFADTEIHIGQGQDQVTPASFTDAFVRQLVDQGAEVREATDAEAIAAAAENGIDLRQSGAGKAPLQWGRPWVIVKAGLGFPGAVAASAEVYVLRTLTVELGGGAGPLGSVFQGAIRWRPDATCWGCEGRNLFSIGFGLDAGYMPQAEGSGTNHVLFAAASVDAHYIHRFAKHFGWVIGLKLGVGTGTTFGAIHPLPAEGETVFNHVYVENTGALVMPVALLYTGFSF